MHRNRANVGRVTTAEAGNFHRASAGIRVHSKQQQKLQSKIMSKMLSKCWKCKVPVSSMQTRWLGIRSCLRCVANMLHAHAGMENGRAARLLQPVA